MGVRLPRSNSIHPPESMRRLVATATGRADYPEGVSSQEKFLEVGAPSRPGSGRDERISSASEAEPLIFGSRIGKNENRSLHVARGVFEKEIIISSSGPQEHHWVVVAGKCDPGNAFEIFSVSFFPERCFDRKCEADERKHDERGGDSFSGTFTVARGLENDGEEYQKQN